MKKMNTFVMMLALILAFSVSAVFAASPTETKEKSAVTKTTDTTGAKAAPAKLTDKVNINTADQATLEKIKGIGPKKAEDIIAYRKANGNFKSIEDLGKVKGIGPKILEKIKPNITI